jgi:hypothetical protein
MVLVLSKDKWPITESQGSLSRIIPFVSYRERTLENGVEIKHHVFRYCLQMDLLSFQRSGQFIPDQMPQYGLVKWLNGWDIVSLCYSETFQCS